MIETIETPSDLRALMSAVAAEAAERSLDALARRLPPEDQLMSLEDCIAAIWPVETSRPSVRTFREWQAARIIPHHKVGKMVFFNPVAVRQALEAYQVKAR